jgi:hypothetical protein
MQRKHEIHRQNFAVTSVYETTGKSSNVQDKVKGRAMLPMRKFFFSYITILMIHNVKPITTCGQAAVRHLPCTVHNYHHHLHYLFYLSQLNVQENINFKHMCLKYRISYIHQSPKLHS